MLLNLTMTQKNDSCHIWALIEDGGQVQTRRRLVDGLRSKLIDSDRPLLVKYMPPSAFAQTTFHYHPRPPILTQITVQFGSRPSTFRDRSLLGLSTFDLTRR